MLIFWKYFRNGHTLDLHISSELKITYSWPVFCVVIFLARGHADTETVRGIILWHDLVHDSPTSKNYGTPAGNGCIAYLVHATLTAIKIVSNRLTGVSVC